MAKRFSRHKISRKFGVDIYGTGGPALARRISVPPGGVKTTRIRKSDFAKQLMEKQKVKFTYGVRERQFRRYFGLALRSREPAGRALLQILERRLDNVVYRLGFARTRPMARHLVSYGHVLVDGKRVDKPSYLLSPGETVSLSPRAIRLPDVVDEMKAHRPALSWLSRENGAGKVTALPVRDEIAQDVNEALIVEFYSR
jgi:small subunit ribosomal protein S4